MTHRSYDVSSTLPSRLIYQEAIAVLNSLKTHPLTLEEPGEPGSQVNQTSLREMQEWLPRINRSPMELNDLNIVHVTGTKGKGSTCAFVSSILQHLFPRNRIGQFTSPHLKAVNERIKINSVPVSNELFRRYFWEIWDQLEKAVETEGLDKSYKPSPFRFIGLMAFHIFLDMKVFFPTFAKSDSG